MGAEKRTRSWQDFQTTPDHGPPIDVLPGYICSSRFLVRTDDVAITVGSFRVWQRGFMFTLSVRLSPSGLAKLGEEFVFDKLGPEDPDVLLEMRWPDGRRVSNTKVERPGGKTFGVRHGGGWGPRWDLDWWVSPLPHPPAITLACTWPAANISDAAIEVSAQELQEAADRQIQLWQ